jgi:hypothetical protein
MIYQEDIMRVATKVAGFSMTEADDLRKGVFEEDPRDDSSPASEVRRRFRA